MRRAAPRATSFSWDFSTAWVFAGRHFPLSVVFGFSRKRARFAETLVPPSPPPILTLRLPPAESRQTPTLCFAMRRELGGSRGVVWMSVKEKFPQFELRLWPPSRALSKSVRSHWRNVKRGNPTAERGAAKLGGLRLIKQCVHGLRLTRWHPDSRQVSSSLAVCDKVGKRGTSGVFGQKKINNGVFSLAPNVSPNFK